MYGTVQKIQLLVPGKIRMVLKRLLTYDILPTSKKGGWPMFHFFIGLFLQLAISSLKRYTVEPDLPSCWTPDWPPSACLSLANLAPACLSPVNLLLACL
jgi:hypothetical protein